MIESNSYSYLHATAPPKIDGGGVCDGGMGATGDPGNMTVGFVSVVC